MRERDRKMAAPDQKGRDRMPAATKRRTMGVDPKVPAQAVATIVVWVLAYFAIDLDAEVATAISVLLGIPFGVLAPAPRTVTVPARDRRA